MLGGVEGSEELRHLLQPLQLVSLGAEPDRLRLERRLRHEHGDDVDRRAVAHGFPRVAHHLLRDGDATEVELDAEPRVDALRLLDRRLRLLLRLRVPLDARRRHEGDAILEGERLDEVLLAEVEVDRALVDRRVRPVALDEPEERARLGVHDGERLRVARSQRDARRGIVASLPDVAG